MISAKLCGIHTMLIGTKVKNLDYNSKTGLSDKEKGEYALIQANIRVNIGNIYNAWERIGYECLGAVLWGFSNWLAHDLQQNGITKIFFLAREGEILKKTFELLYPNIFECHYLYVSRRSLAVPSFYGAASFEDVVERISFPKNITVSNFLNYIGLEDNDVMPEIIKSGLEATERISGWNVSENEKVKNLYGLIKGKAEKVFEEQNNYIQRYFNQENFNGRIAIVDIGWNCTMQSAIERLVVDRNTKIKGYYLGVNEKNKLQSKSSATGYIYEPGRNMEYQYYIMGMSGPLEMMTTAHHGTTLAYKEEGGNVIPVLGESEYFGSVQRPEAKPINLMQRGALQFIKQMKNCPSLLQWDVSGKAAFHNFYLFGKQPLLKHRRMFYGMKEYDSAIELTMLDPNAHGLVGKNSIINGFWNSSWKIGYMKDKFKIPLPYDRIYKIMRERKK